MDTELREALIACETDLDAALYRFSSNDKLYVACLKDFLYDETMLDLDSALNTESWDDAFTAVHALKGMAGNMGFLPLFHAAAQMVILIRTGQISEVDSSYQKLIKEYQKITFVIQEYVK